ncbi:hypothetical protein MASR1M65_27830 [Saprospiraceae bacterium]
MKVIDWCQFDINNNQLTNGGLPLTYDDLVEWFPNLPWHNQCNYTIPGFPYNVLASEDDGDGYWEHIQYVKVIDKTKPAVECKDTTICSYGACEENVTLVGKASDGCDTGWPTP